MKIQRPVIGAHVSAAGGLYKSIENAERIGAEAIQIFGISPRQWTGKLPSDEDVEKYLRRREKSVIRNAYLHAAYLVNLASPNPYILEQSIKSLTDHLSIASRINAVGLVFHVGSGKGATDREKVLMQEVKAMKEILKNVPGDSFLIMENSAGGGDKVGSGVGEVGFLLREVRSSRVKVCFDTAHGFEAGLVTEYTEASVKALFDLWDKEVGLDNIVVIHANDSKTASGSHHDKHDNIGEGYIGLKGFKALAKEKRLWGRDWVLEVPGFEDEGPDAKNIEILKRCFK